MDVFFIGKINHEKVINNFESFPLVFINCLIISCLRKIKQVKVFRFEQVV